MLKYVHIGNLVTSIGGSAFCFCNNLEYVIIGENVKEIGGSAFSSCPNLKCIYFYGTKEPYIGVNAFANVSAAVMVPKDYIDRSFGNLYVTTDTVEGCAPMPTQSNTFSHSNTFTASLRSDLSQTFSFTLTVSLSVSYSLTYSAIDTQTISYYLSNSELTYVETNFIYYNYTVIVYSTYYSYYSNFFTYVYLSPSDEPGGITTAALIGIICGAVAFVLIVVAAVTFLVKSNNRKEKSSVKLQFKETTTSTTKQYDDVDSIVEELAKEDEDNWL
ncbi:leucine-rich repeat domain-containing protein [Histomonas meleagridis]|nr:leucine-rich repeat domain-containing protein [Histomonas meleagridis]